MGRADYLALGDHNAICYFCGMKGKASKMVRNWQGFFVHPEHNEERHPQDFVRPVPDDQSVEWSQPPPAAVYTYEKQFMGIGDGVQREFQLGSGLYGVTVDSVFVDGVSVSFTAGENGLCLLDSAPGKDAIVSGDGLEEVI